jgi:N-acetylgalactosamine-N,N'-diacetylbacillosaminyl-diphospho-undecaprenol 4-alpha-N-acetylgalactosaminyltransferase
MQKKKIVLIGFRLNKGGAERVMASLSNYLAAQNFDVHIITILDDIAYSHSGKVFNLGKLKNKSNGLSNKLKRLIALNNYFKKNEFDVLIDFRFRINFFQEFILSRFVFKLKTIYTVHSSQLNVYIPKHVFLANLIYKKADKIVAITHAMQSLIEDKYNFKNVTTIYNPVNLDAIEKFKEAFVDLKEEYVISAGQFDTNEKQFDKLIATYAKSVLPKQNVVLVLLGQGSNMQKLKNHAKSCGVEDKVLFLGFKKNPYKYFKNAKFYIMSSMYEGMPMVLIEALASGIPVISFNCPTGPSEIIRHEENGLLVKNQDFKALVASVNRFANDKKLYNYCKNNAISSSHQFSIDKIGIQWLDLIN